MTNVPPDQLAAEMRRWAAGDYGTEAAAELLIRHDRWLHRPEFVRACIGHDDDLSAWWVHWGDIPAVLDDPPGCSSTELHILAPGSRARRPQHRPATRRAADEPRRPQRRPRSRLHRPRADPRRPAMTGPSLTPARRRALAVLLAGERRRRTVRYSNTTTPTNKIESARELSVYWHVADWLEHHELIHRHNRGTTVLRLTTHGLQLAQELEA